VNYGNAPHVWIGCKKLKAFLDVVRIAFRLILAKTLYCIKVDCEKVLIGSLGEPIFSHSASHGFWLLLVPRQKLRQRYVG
jgi:hypothetical protein